MKPTRPGLYWLKAHYTRFDTGERVWQVSTMVAISPDLRGQLRVYRMGTAGTDKLDRYPDDFLWYGPLDSPLDAQEDK